MVATLRVKFKYSCWALSATKIGAPLQETPPPTGVAPLLGGGMPAATNLRIMICAASPALLHRVAVMSAGTLDSLPHNGAVVTLLAVTG